MPTRLTRDTTRVVSDRLVATLTKEGLVLRRPYGRRKALVTWTDLEREYLHDSEGGLAAFGEPLPRRWLPRVGEPIWVKPRDTAWRGEVSKVLSGMGEQIVVALLGTKRRREVRVLLSQTRPIGGGEVEAS